MVQRIRLAMVMVVVAGVPSAATIAAAYATIDVSTGALSAQATLDMVLLPLVSGALTVTLAWLTAVAFAGCVAAGRDATGHTRQRVAPRRAAATGLAAPSPATGLTAAVAGLIVMLAGTGTATAAPAAPAAIAAPAAMAAPAAIDVTDVTRPDQSPVAGWTPALSATPAAVSRLIVGTATPDRMPTAATHVVVRGDSLWSIAATRLGPGATAAEVAAEWPRWWQANRDVIGDDPDLIRPGQSLQAPA